MWDLFRLFAFHTMETEAFECEIRLKSISLSDSELTPIFSVFCCNAVTKSDLDRLPARVQELMSRIRPHAVNLVDSWMIPDYLLDRYKNYSFISIEDP
jgi:acyl-CoA oxidase